MSVNVGHLYKKRIVRDLQGNIINWIDETDGGWIVRNRQVVNQDKINLEAAKEKDRQESAKAQTMPAENHVPDRVEQPSKMAELETKVNDMGNKLDAILKALNK